MHLKKYMVINEEKITALIEKSALVAPAELSLVKSQAAHLGVSVIDLLLGKALITEENYGNIVSSYFEVPYISLKTREIVNDILFLIPEDLASEKNVIAFDKVDGEIYIALENPKDLDLIETVKKTIGSRKVKVFVSTQNELKEVIRSYKHKKSDEVQTSDSKETAVGLVNRILEEAIKQEASDVHIEILEDKFLIRFRVDGVLHDEGVYKKELNSSVVARIKILSDLKLDETRLPQDGQFSFKTKSGNKVSLRVSTSPTVYGEKVVMRILQTNITHFNLEDLGFLTEDMKILEKGVKKTHGMLLVTGPTGSGKTTTLYTILGLLNKSDVNIITVEDPVENRIARVNQIQINPLINLTFASGLRSILRQDPDVIMVGEIRDHDTSVIAVNAAMTGHLVLSTVHANTASGVIPRMIDLGAEPFLLASTLNLVIAQRLVRVLCPKCKQKVKPDKVLQKKVYELKEFVSPSFLRKFKNNFQSKGCSNCFNTGYKGRVGIFEILAIEDDIKELIVGKASSQKIWNEARKKGAKSILEDGLLKVDKGITSLEEVLRVISN